MRWSRIAARQPGLAAVATEKLIGPGVVLAGTIRHDGRARISGVEPLIMDGELWLSMLPDSAKARDLERDARIVLNSIITGPAPDAEIKVRGTARRETGAVVLERYAAAVAADLGCGEAGLTGAGSVVRAGPGAGRSYFLFCSAP